MRLLYAMRAGIARTSLIRAVRYARRYRGLSVDPAANMHVQGSFAYGRECTVSLGCNILVPVGAKLSLGDNCYLGRFVELGPSGDISIGSHTSLQDRCILVGDIKVGRCCVFSLNVLMTSGHHYYDRWPHLLIRDQDELVAIDPAAMEQHSRPINIDEDCWFGMNSVVMRGVNVGRGCVVGANSVVTRDLQPYSVAVGAPARVIKKRLNFAPPPRIEWDVPEHGPYFYSGFEARNAERQKNNVWDGLVAADTFSVWLGNRSSQMMVLRVRSLGKSRLRTPDGNNIELSDAPASVECRYAGPDAPSVFQLAGNPVSVNSVFLV